MRHEHHFSFVNLIVKVSLINVNMIGFHVNLGHKLDNLQHDYKSFAISAELIPSSDSFI